MTGKSQVLRIRLEYAVVAAGMLMTVVSLGVLAQSITVLAMLVSLVLLAFLLRWQQHEQPSFDLRPHADSGLWLTLLLPFSLLTGGNGYEHGETYALARVVCTQALLLSLAAIFRVTNVFISLLSAAWTVTLLVTSTGISLLWSAAASLATAGTFNYLVRSLSSYSPKSFTIGELLIVCQGVATFVVISACSITCKMTYGDHCIFESSASVGFLQAGLFVLIVFAAAVSKTAALQTPRGFYFGLFFSAFTLVYPLCWLMVETEPVTWLLYQCFRNYTRTYLMVSWTALSITAASFAYWYSTKYSDSSTVVRKVFHIATIAALLPGIILEPDLAYLACGAIIGVFILLEMTRILSIPPVGPCIHTAFAMFLDEKDAGKLILTPIYLFVGCATPLLLFPGQFEAREKTLVLLSGTVVLGVGDTAASVVGSRLGKHHWPGTSKTVEGTLAAIIAQFSFYLPLLLLTAVQSVWHISTALLAVILCLASCLEAFTTQVDNIALPVYVYPMMAALYAL
ncbi:hypothetical protein HPB48_005356 [Haemaphysalis longicornis]|uniref:dolichol kinase n=1 Tax=Haemaphysalis longicornis TaxID=44386 RepID=A0A9J6GGV4_HAELO|nr:hypothetical protein HPB48_005356 [Haemaphysalis longicornis]